MLLSKRLALSAIISQIRYLLDIVSIKEIREALDEHFGKEDK